GNPEVAGVATSHGRPRRTRDAGFTMRSHWVRPTRGCSVTTGLRVLDRESRACRSILDAMVGRVLAKDAADASGILLLLDILGQAPRVSIPRHGNRAARPGARHRRVRHAGS